MNDTNNTQTAPAADEIADTAAAAPVAAPMRRWGWKRVSMYAGVAIVATAATYLGVKLVRKPKAVADAAAAVVDAAIPAA